MNNFYQGKKVVITGGAGFIGSHLLDQLIKLNAKTVVIDNLSSGSLENVYEVWQKNNLKFTTVQDSPQIITAGECHKFIFCDLTNFSDINKILAQEEAGIVFHLAAVVGGRGFIDDHPADCCNNFTINTNLFKAAYLNKVKKVIYSSSACVYPIDRQTQTGHSKPLSEDEAMVKNWANADLEYGWSKLMGELTLKAYFKQYKLKSAIVRYVTAYGPRQNDTHSVIALIKKALQKKEPYVIWGNGEQERDFNFVEDLVAGTLLAGEKISDATVINLSSNKTYTIKQLTQLILDILGNNPKIVFDLQKPAGVVSRVLNNKRAKKLLNWAPQTTLEEGLKKTIIWYENKT